MVVILLDIPINSVRGFLFSIPSPAFIVCRLFDDSHSDWFEVKPRCIFDLHFSIISDVERLFIGLLAVHVSTLERCLLRSFAHFLKLDCLFDVELYEMFVYFGY